jgi:glycosyltransferase involved in cell wall biosynthesis
MYEKIATSISKIEGVEVFVAGFKGIEISPPINIHLVPLFNFPRLSWKRFLAPWKFYKLLLKVKPKLIIITTHELLIVTSLYKILFGGKIIYDVQENYYRNIAFTNTYPPLFRNLLAGWVRLKEYLTRPLIYGYLLAEKNYEKEFSFTRKKSLIIENKTKRPDRKNWNLPITSDKIKLLYSGTISKEYGIFEAIKLAQKLHEIDPKISLTIIGYCANSQTLKSLKEQIQGMDYIHLKGGETLVPHQEILEEIHSNHFGLISYLPNKSTMNCVPTKLYEYLAFRLPVISQPNPIWAEMIQNYQAGIVVDFQKTTPQSLLLDLYRGQFYTKITDPKELFWEGEEEKLIRLIKTFLVQKLEF